MKSASYAAIHPRRRAIYVLIAWRRSRVNTLLKRRQLSRRVKNDYHNRNHSGFYIVPALVPGVDRYAREGQMNKSKHGHLGRLIEKKSKAADMYIRKLRTNAKLRLMKKWRKKWIKLAGKAWDFEGKWRDE